MTQLLHPVKPPPEDWPELIPLDYPKTPRLDLNRLPGWAGEYAMALSETTETPPELVASMVLATAATACARRLRVCVKPGYSEPTNLWWVTTLPPGNRKSAVMTAATAPLAAWERDQVEAVEPEVRRITSERSTLEVRVKELRRRAARAKDPAEAHRLARKVAEIEADLPDIPTPPRLFTSDATPERLGALLSDHGECMAWLSSEGGVFDLLEGRYSGGVLNLDLLLKAHSGDPERVDRQGRPPVLLDCPRLTLGLTVQPEVLRGMAAKPGFLGRGLLARFLYLMPPSPVGYRSLNAPPMPESIKRAYEAGIRTMLGWPAATDEHGREQPHVLTLSREAAGEWLDFAKAVEAEMRPGGCLEHLKDWGAKAAGAAVRLAGVLHGIKHAHGEPWRAEITQATLQDALEIVAIIQHHTLAAYALMGGDPELAGAEKVWDWIERGRRDRFSVRDAFQALRGTFKTMAALSRPLEILEERAYIRIEEQSRHGPGRPRSPLVRVRPDIVRGWR